VCKNHHQICTGHLANEWECTLDPLVNTPDPDRCPSWTGLSCSLSFSLSTLSLSHFASDSSSVKQDPFINALFELKGYTPSHMARRERACQCVCVCVCVCVYVKRSHSCQVSLSGISTPLCCTSPLEPHVHLPQPPLEASPATSTLGNTNLHRPARHPATEQ
jgi:hypothetical protein